MAKPKSIDTTPQFYPMTRVRVLLLGYYKFAKLNENLERKFLKLPPNEQTQINKEKYSVKELEGVKRDIDTLKALFRDKFHYEVDECLNLDKKETEAKLMENQEKLNSEKYDALIVCISSHGGDDATGLFFQTDEGAIFYLEKVVETFSDENCSNMVGKPKLYFVDACQGKGTDYGRLTERKGSDASEKLRVPSFADILIATSSVEGFVSYSSNSGSLFMSTFAHVLSRYWDQLDLGTMLTIVQGIVARRDLEQEEDQIDAATNTTRKVKLPVKQMPLCYSTLTKFVLFGDKSKSTLLFLGKKKRLPGWLTGCFSSGARLNNYS